MASPASLNNTPSGFIKERLKTLQTKIDVFHNQHKALKRIEFDFADIKKEPKISKYKSALRATSPELSLLYLLKHNLLVYRFIVELVEQQLKLPVATKDFELVHELIMIQFKKNALTGFLIFAHHMLTAQPKDHILSLGTFHETPFVFTVYNLNHSFENKIGMNLFVFMNQFLFSAIRCLYKPLNDYKTQYRAVLAEQTPDNQKVWTFIVDVLQQAVKKERELDKTISLEKVCDFLIPFSTLIHDQTHGIILESVERVKPSEDSEETKANPVFTQPSLESFLNAIKAEKIKIERPEQLFSPQRTPALQQYSVILEGMLQKTNAFVVALIGGNDNFIKVETGDPEKFYYKLRQTDFQLRDSIRKDLKSVYDEILKKIEVNLNAAVKKRNAEDSSSLEKVVDGVLIFTQPIQDELQRSLDAIKIKYSNAESIFSFECLACEWQLQHKLSAAAKKDNIVLTNVDFSYKKRLKNLKDSSQFAANKLLPVYQSVVDLHAILVRYFNNIKKLASQGINLSAAWHARFLVAFFDEIAAVKAGLIILADIYKDDNEDELINESEKIYFYSMENDTERNKFYFSSILIKSLKKLFHGNELGHLLSLIEEHFLSDEFNQLLEPLLIKLGMTLQKILNHDTVISSVIRIIRPFVRTELNIEKIDPVLDFSRSLLPVLQEQGLISLLFKAISPLLKQVIGALRPPQTVVAPQAKIAEEKVDSSVENTKSVEDDKKLSEQSVASMPEKSKEDADALFSTLNADLTLRLSNYQKNAFTLFPCFRNKNRATQMTDLQKPIMKNEKVCENSIDKIKILIDRIFLLVVLIESESKFLGRSHLQQTLGLMLMYYKYDIKNAVGLDVDELVGEKGNLMRYCR